MAMRKEPAHRQSMRSRRAEAAAAAPRPERLYHGTDTDLSVVRPGAEVGRRNWDQSKKVPGASATASEEYAWHYAQDAEHHHGGRARVYAVDPHPDMQPGKLAEEWVAPHFAVRSSHDIKPGHQGTFLLNWRQFSTSDVARVNHPSPAEVENGHPNSRMYLSNTPSRLRDKPAPEPEHPGQGALFTP